MERERERETATYCNILRHIATHCNTLQLFIAPKHRQNTISRSTCTERETHTHCNILQHTVSYCNILQHTATYCNYSLHLSAAKILISRSIFLVERKRHSHTATYCKILPHPTTSCNILQYTITHCNTLQLIVAPKHRLICQKRPAQVQKVPHTKPAYIKLTLHMYNVCTKSATCTENCFYTSTHETCIYQNRPAKITCRLSRPICV